jgi:hypothetical protein
VLDRASSHSKRWLRNTRNSRQTRTISRSSLSVADDGVEPRIHEELTGRAAVRLVSVAIHIKWAGRSVGGRIVVHVTTVAGPAIVRRLDGRRPHDGRVRSWRARRVRGVATGTTVHTRLGADRGVMSMVMESRANSVSLTSFFIGLCG